MRPGEKEVAVAGQWAVALHGSFDAALDVRPALGVNQGVGGFDTGRDLRGADADGEWQNQHADRRDRSRDKGALGSHRDSPIRVAPCQTNRVLELPEPHDDRGRDGPSLNVSCSAAPIVAARESAP
jgi:hypothetical protein